MRGFFEEAGGAFIKFGQLLALRVDVLPKEYSLEMIDLFDHVPPFSYQEVERVFLYELGVTPDKIFPYFEKEPFASASFGQVHAAKLSDNEKVIVKIQRPDIREKVGVDFFIIDILSFIADLFLKIEALPWREFAKEFKDWTKRELDYQIEAENTQRIYDNVATVPGLDVVIPKTYHRYTTKKILVQEYIDGVPLSRVLKEIKREKLTVEQLRKMGIDIKKAPRIVLTEMMRQYFFDGFFHADPHPGNILLLENGKVGLIDFGIVGEAAPKRQAFMKFIKAGAENKYDQAGYYFLEFAGSDLEQIISSVLPATVSQKQVDDFMASLADHFSQYCKKIETQMKKDLEVMKIDYTIMALQMLKFAQRYQIKLPKQMAVFIKALSIISFLAKEIDYKFYLTDIILHFCKKYPVETIPKKEISVSPYKRINREEAIDRFNNWLAYLLEIDQKLYQLVENYMSSYKFAL